MNPVYGQSRHASVFFYRNMWMLSYHVWFDSSIRRRKPALAELEFNTDGSIQPVMPIDEGRFIK